MFGIMNSIQRAIYRILATVQCKYAQVYLDYVIVFFTSPADHLDHVWEVIGLLQSPGMASRLTKIIHLVPLEHNLPGNTFRGQSDFGRYLRDVTSSHQNPSPLVLGILKCVSRVIRLLFSDWKWGNPLPSWRSELFYSQTILTSPSVLKFCWHGHSYARDTDACNRNVGWVLIQRYDVKENRPVGYWSRILC